jgi:hypothetical protein
MTKTFIQATEVWVPSHDGSRLEFASGNYGTLHSLREASAGMTFKYDEGLPGKAWAHGHPVILKRFEGSYFKRADLATELGLTCGIAIPVFAGDFIKAVVVFLCGDDDEQVGAIEVWYNNASVSYDMNLHDGYYGSAEIFEWLSSRTHFRRGDGLPGLAWQKNFPVLLPDLPDSAQFVRKNEAVNVGLNKALGLPFVTGKQTHVVTLLSAHRTPIARRIEIWRPDPTRNCLIFDSGQCDEQPEFATAYEHLGIEAGVGVIGEVWLSGIPQVRMVNVPEPSVAELNAQMAGLQTTVAMPMIANGRLTSVVSWYF